MPEVKKFTLIVMMKEDLKVYRAVITARDYVEACRAIIHEQMAKGTPILQITNGKPPG
jgi:hypothetical protein